MIDDATIKRVAMQSTAHREFGHPVLKCSEMLSFARAIEQLARQEQKEEDARICNELSSYQEDDPGESFAEAIRASGKENSNA